MDRPHLPSSTSGSSSRRLSNKVSDRSTAVSATAQDETTRQSTFVNNTAHGPSTSASTSTTNHHPRPRAPSASTSTHRHPSPTIVASSSTPYIHPPFQPSNLSSAQSINSRPAHSIVTAVSATASDASSSNGVRRRLSNPATSPVATSPRRRSRGDSLFTPAEDLPVPTYSSPLAWFGNDSRAKRKKSSEDLDKDYSSDRSSSSRIHMTGSSRLTSDSDGSPPLVASKPLLGHSLSTRPSYSSMSLTPLPQDPNNILPLSLPGTPYVTPLQTPGISPHPSIGDIKDYIGQYTSSASAGSSSNRSPSPRTSISTSASSSYDPGRSDSSLSGDEAPLRSAGWWARSNQPRSTIRVAKSRLISLPPLPTGTRSWGWLMSMIPRSGSASAVKTKTRRFRPRRDTLRERERGKAKQRESITGIGAIDRCLEALPAKAMTIALSLLAFGAFALFMTVTLKHVLNPDKTPLPWRSYCSASQPTVYSLQPEAPTSSFFGDSTALSLAPLTPAHPQWPYSTSEPPSIAASLELAPVGVFVGVFTTDEKVERRNMIRQSYGSHPRSRRSGTEGVKVMFIMGRPRRSYRKAVELESEAFGDILLLDMPENMNSGKTHAFFTWASQHATVPDVEYVLDDSEVVEQSDQLDDVRVKAVVKGDKKPDYVVKADDDSFIMLGELERRLRVAPRSMAYWGYLVKDSFMAGEAYGMSMDLVNYIATSSNVRSVTRGKEDKLVSKWMRMHPQATAITWITDKCWMYDHPKAGTVYSHGFLFPSTVAEIRMDDLSTASSIEREFLPLAQRIKRASYSSVSRFKTIFRPMVHDLSAGESVESLIEGSQLSLLDPHHHHKHNGKPRPNPAEFRADIRQVYAQRPSRKERFMNDERELGGTVVIHYIKKPEWFVETWLALLGGVEEEDGRLPVLEEGEGVKLGKGHGL